MSKPIVVIFSFGSKETKGNKILALLGTIARKRKMAIITQKDIPLSAEDGGTIIFVEDFKNSPGWHSTLWVAYAAKEICESRGMEKKCVVVVAKPHLSRCVRDMEKIGFCVLESITQEYNWFDLDSEQPWTTSWFKWWRRELLLRLMPWWLYKKVTLRP